MEDGRETAVGVDDADLPTPEASNIRKNHLSSNINNKALYDQPAWNDLSGRAKCAPSTRPFTARTLSSNLMKLDWLMWSLFSSSSSPISIFPGIPRQPSHRVDPIPRPAFGTHPSIINLHGPPA